MKGGEKMLKTYVCSMAGVIFSGIAYALGGWDESVITLLIFMSIDFITGLVVGGVFHKSGKTETGALESRAGWKGLCKKCCVLLLVVVANRLDMQMGSTYIRDGVCIAFMVNELISIIENIGLMGVPIPAIIMKSIEVLKKKGSE
jgi:toxin secretion/phage lysis holin